MAAKKPGSVTSITDAKKADPPARKPRQAEIPGTERKVNKTVAAAARSYVEARDARMELTKKEKDSKELLIAAMVKAGEEVYRDDSASPPLLVHLKKGKNDVKVTEVGEDPESDDDAE